MKIRKLHLVVLLVFLVLSLRGTDTTSWILLNPSIVHFEIPEEKLSFYPLDKDVSFNDLEDLDFIQGQLWGSKQPDVNNYNCVVKLNVSNSSDFESDWWLNIPGNYITCYVTDGIKVIDTFYTGNLLKKSERPIPSIFKKNSFVPLTMNARDSLTIYCLIEQSHFYPLNSRQLAFSRPNETEWRENQFINGTGFQLGLITAAILILGIYAFGFFLFSREKYALFLALRCIFDAALIHGFHSGIYRFNIDPSFILYFGFAAANLTGIFDMFFLSSFVKKEFQLFKWSRLLNLLGWGFVVFTVLATAVYFFNKHFFSVLVYIAAAHGCLNAVRMVLGLYLIRKDSLLHLLVGSTLISTMILFLSSAYYTYNSDFYGYTLSKYGTLIYALGTVIFLGYIAVIYRKEKIESDTLRLIADSKVQELNEMDIHKNILFSNIAHELRTPLSLILGPLSSVTSRLKINDGDKKMLQTAHRNAKDLLKKVDSILDLAKMDNKNLLVNAHTVDLYPHFLEWITDFQEIAKDLEVEIILDYKIQENILLLIDRIKLESIVKNLISNGLKAMPTGGRMNVNVKTCAGQLFIDISDTGIGIPKADQELIFDRFYQVSGLNSEDKGGTGIGLALTKEYVELMGGQILIESILGVGSTFFVKIPVQFVAGKNVPSLKPLMDLAIGNLNSNFPLTTSGQESVESSILKPDKPVILLVEDNIDFRYYLASLLKDKFNLFTAKNGIEALGILGQKMKGSDIGSREDTVDLIITDLMMPLMNGYELIESLKSQQALSGIPVIILTARSDMASMDEAIRFGIDSYMVKPFDNDQLFANIDVLLSRSKVRQESLLVSAEERSSSSKIAEEQPEWLENFRTFVLDHISSPNLTIDEVAKNIFIGKRQLHRRMNISIGMTPNQCIREMRLEKARQLLLSKKCTSVKDVSLSVGFKKPTYFSKLYFERHGVMPSSYFGH